ncbi:MAG: DNA polymerase I [Bacilli bacterium]|nr:DNA polymerase I [Bacilli bacterium]
MAKCYIVDGNSLLFRAYYATAYAGTENIMRTKDGTPTNAVFAFANMINKMIGNLKDGDYFFVGFDTGKPTFRHIEDKDYKAQRKPAPAELVTQMPIAREMLRSLGIFVYELEGYEGDDLCGTVAKIASNKNIETIVYTSDRDFLQLIDDNITIHILKKGMSDILIMNEESMMTEWGFLPKQIIDYKGLRGDSSDNLPGIPGIGEKTAVKLIQEYGSFDAIVEAAPTMKSKVASNILEFVEQGRMCKRLAEIYTDVPLPFDFEDTKYLGYEFKEANEFCNKYELKQLLNRLPVRFKKVSFAEEKIEYTTIDTFKGIDVGTNIGIALDIEDENYNNALIYGLAVSFDNKHYYIDAEHFENDDATKEILSNPNINKYCYDFKSIKVALSRKNIEIKGLKFDLLLAAYLLDSSLQNDVSSIMHYFGIDLEEANDDSMSLLGGDSNPLKASKIAYFTYKLSTKTTADLEKLGCLKLYNEVEIPLSDVLADMEIEGMPLDTKVLESMGDTFEEKLNESRKKIYAYAGCEFNVDSPKQVGQVLYEKLGLKSPNKKQSTSVDALKELIMLHPIVAEILTYRKYAKLLSTYVSGLVGHVYEDGKIHAIFNQALTTTGRLSSSEPNLQNISVRDEEGKMIRKAFYYKDEKYSILSLDYSQIELRILAHLSDCKALKEVFAAGEDIHTATAKKVFHTNEVTSLQRRKAKAVNFGIIYGISDWGLSDQIGTSVFEAREIINNFYEAFPEIGEYFTNVKQSAVDNCYVTTMFGRRRYLREVHDSNYQVREFAKRAAMNAPIQGTAADLIKIAMIKVKKALHEGGYETKLISQIHDELLFKVPENEKDVIYKLVKDTMEHAIDIEVQLEVDGGFGRTWYDAK